MKTIALRFADNYAPADGTIKLHEDVINEYGYVWYGKFGNSLSQKNIDMLLEMKEKRFLLIKSGGQERYWAHFEDIKKAGINIEAIPKYYRDDKERGTLEIFVFWYARFLFLCHSAVFRVYF